jgi:serine/threonine protein kinase
MSFNVGENVGPYRVIEQLGQGGMATVYKAYHASLDRYVALKVLHAAFGEDPNFEARFQREARVVAKLEHPNIVPVYDYSEHEKQPFLVMKFIEGETLKARMARGPLSAEELGRIIASIGGALAYAHHAGILHRDIKPSNVLLAVDGSIYLADFGLARIASMGESTLSGDMIMGTPQYISPEQAMGKKELDEGTDIYSFGVMLYEMVVGQVPFNADTPFSIIHDHIYSPLPIPHVINPSVPEPVERVLLKALAKERADRYKTVDELVSAFIESWNVAGVPMKGTMITLRPKAVAAPVAQAVPVASNAPTMAKAVPAKKARIRWPVIVAGVLFLVCCLVVLIAVRDGRLLRKLKPPKTPTAPLLGGSPTSVAPINNATVPVLPPPARGIGLIDNFDGASPAGDSGWQGYFDESTDTKITCAPNPDSSHLGPNSLLFQFDIAANSWATCGLYFDIAQDWSAGRGLSFYVRSERAGLPFRVDMYGGAPGALTTYYFQAETPPGSVEDWTLMEIAWNDILRAEWQENPGTPFRPKKVAGVSIGVSTEGAERIEGAIWLDDLSLYDKRVSAPEADSTPNPAVLEALQLVEQNPNDPRAHLQLAFAYWDNGQTRQSFETLNRAGNLAPAGDRGFFLDAAQGFVEREAWISAAAMYLRAIKASPVNGPLPPELELPMHEAVYMASGQPEMPNFLPFESIARVDQPIAGIAEARFALTSGDTVRARELLGGVKNLNPNMPEIRLLESEILFREGKREDARLILTGLTADLATPEWIRRLADSYLIKFQ